MLRLCYGFLAINSFSLCIVILNSVSQKIVNQKTKFQLSSHISFTRQLITRKIITFDIRI